MMDIKTDLVVLVLAGLRPVSRESWFATIPTAVVMAVVNVSPAMTIALDGLCPSGKHSVGAMNVNDFFR